LRRTAESDPRFLSRAGKCRREVTGKPPRALPILPQRRALSRRCSMLPETWGWPGGLRAAIASNAWCRSCAMTSPSVCRCSAVGWMNCARWGPHRVLPPFSWCLRVARGRAGRVSEGLAAIEQAFMLSERYEERWCLPELLRNKGGASALQGLGRCLARGGGVSPASARLGGLRRNPGVGVAGGDQPRPFAARPRAAGGGVRSARLGV
jgi:hypothetical protein